MQYDLEALSRTYQSSSDLDFELQVHNQLKSAGCLSDHGGRYLDPISGKLREYDILAKPPTNNLDGRTATASFRHIEMSVECKNIDSDFPLIVGAREFEYEQVKAIRLVRDHKLEVIGYQDSIPISKMHGFVAAFGQDFIEYIGVETIQIPVKGKLPDRGALYDKWSQAVSHASVRYSGLIEAIATGSTNGTFPIWCPAILVVPDERLLLAIRGPARSSLRQVDAVLVKVGHEFTAPRLVGEKVCISNYFIFTCSGINKFIRMFR